jgi:hypothetical protein
MSMTIQPVSRPTIPDQSVDINAPAPLTDATNVWQFLAAEE